MRSRTRAGLLTRLERLESRSAAFRPIKVRFGDLQRLPPDYTGEKHIAMTKQLPNRGDQEWVEYEERPGPDPTPPFRGRTECIDVVFVEAYPTHSFCDVVANALTSATSAALRPNKIDADNST